MDISAFIEEKINHYGKLIVTKNDKFDDMALGELTFYISLRRAINGTATTQDLGLLDAVNDTLQELGILGEKQSFYQIGKKEA
ncbi:MAG: hypothetical protein JNL70_01355 [Saprospiraceae bacterium]|nr:hypothetical protein [Saprospiraceae bacterium]